MKSVIIIAAIYIGLGIIFTAGLFAYSYIHDKAVDDGILNEGYMISREFRNLSKQKKIYEIIKMILMWIYIVGMYMVIIIEEFIDRIPHK